GIAGLVAASDERMVTTYGPEIAGLQRDARPIEFRGDCINRLRDDLTVSGCILGAPSARLSIALIGDSFAGSLVPALRERLEAEGLSALPYIWYSCPSILETSRSEALRWAPGFVRDCRDYVERTMAEIESDEAIRTVVISNNYDWYLNRVSTIN